MAEWHLTMAHKLDGQIVFSDIVLDSQDGELLFARLWDDSESDIMRVQFEILDVLNRPTDWSWELAKVETYHLENQFRD